MIPDAPGADLDPHVLAAILFLLLAVVIALGVAVCELAPDDRKRK